MVLVDRFCNPCGAGGRVTKYFVTETSYGWQFPVASRQATYLCAKYNYHLFLMISVIPLCIINGKICMLKISNT